MHRSEAESGIPHTSRTGGNSPVRCGLTRYRRAAKVIAHVPAPHHHLPRTAPPPTAHVTVAPRSRKRYGATSGTSPIFLTYGQRSIGACGAMRYVAAMRVRHKGLRALHERDDPVRLPAASAEGRPGGTVERARHW